MQIILLEKIGGLGNLGDIVTVKNGYARNFLIPAGKAKRATEANMKEFEARRAELEAKQAEILADARARQEKLDGQTVTVAQKPVWTVTCSVGYQCRHCCCNRCCRHRSRESKCTSAERSSESRWRVRSGSGFAH